MKTRRFLLHLFVTLPFVASLLRAQVPVSVFEASIGRSSFGFNPDSYSFGNDFQRTFNSEAILSYSAGLLAQFSINQDFSLVVGAKFHRTGSSYNVKEGSFTGTSITNTYSYLSIPLRVQYQLPFDVPLHLFGGPDFQFLLEGTSTYIPCANCSEGTKISESTRGFALALNSGLGYRFSVADHNLQVRAYYSRGITAITERPFDFTSDVRLHEFGIGINYKGRSNSEEQRLLSDENSQATFWGIKLGTNRNSAERENIYSYGTSYGTFNSQSSFNAGITVTKHVNRTIALSASLMYDAREISTLATYILSSNPLQYKTIQQQLKFEYISVTPKLQIHTTSGFFLSTGPSVGFLVGNSIRNDENYTAFIPPKAAVERVSMNVGIGTTIHLGLARIVPEVSYDFAITNASHHKEPIGISISSLQFGASILF